VIDPETATPEDFPRWKDRSCTHPAARQQRDGQGLICLDCGILQVIAW
jgi:hypothetical protein